MNTFLAFIFGVSVGYYLFLIITQQRQNKYQKSIEDFYTDILRNILSIQFIKRVNQLVFLKYKEYELIYNLNGNSINVFQGDNCIHTSSSISTNLKDNIVNEIKRLWGTEILNVIELNGNLYSTNIVQEEMNRVSSHIFNLLKQQSGEMNIEELFNWINNGENKTEDQLKDLSVDDILDKINKEGITKLTKEELDFLKKNAE